MQTKTFTDIDIVNRAGMRYYLLTIVEEGHLLIEGDRGYPHYYRIEIRFLDVDYLACAFSIDELYIWRIATPEEATSVRLAFSGLERDVTTIYCLEERNPYLREAHKFFIAARAVEIIVYYDANNPSHVASLQRCAEILSQGNVALDQRIEATMDSISPNTAVGLGEQAEQA